MSTLKSRTVALLATHGFEQSELDHPRAALRRAGAAVHILAPEGEEIIGRRGDNWGAPVPVTRTLLQAEPVDYDAIDGRPVDILFVLIVPEQKSDDHIKTLAKLAELFSDEDLCYTLRQTLSNEDLYNIAITY